MANSHTRIIVTLFSIQRERNRTELNRTKLSWTERNGTEAKQSKANAEQQQRIGYTQYYYCNIIALAYSTFPSHLFERQCSTLGVMIMLLVPCEDKTLFVLYTFYLSFSVLLSPSFRNISTVWCHGIPYLNYTKLLPTLRMLQIHWILSLCLRMLYSVCIWNGIFTSQTQLNFSKEARSHSSSSQRVTDLSSTLAQPNKKYRWRKKHQTHSDCKYLVELDWKLQKERMRFCRLLFIVCILEGSGSMQMRHFFSYYMHMEWGNRQQ